MEGMGMKIIITGNMGYIGPIVVKRLRRSFPDATLIGIDTCFFGHCLAGPHMLPEGRLDQQILADVRAVGPDVFEGADALVQLSAISNDPMGKLFETQTDEVNHQACVRLAEFAKEAGVRNVVFASSCSVYGFAEGGPRTESAELNPLTAYARSKLAGEEDLERLADDDFVVTCLRFPTACGMSPRIRLDLVLNDFVAAALACGEVQVLSDGTPWRPLIDVKDMALAIEWGIQRKPEQGGAFLAINAGRDESNYQVREIAEAVGELVPGASVSINTNAQPDRRSYQVDFGLYRKLARDFLPQVDLKQSISEVIRGLTALGFADEKFRESDFIRLKVLSGYLSRGMLNDDLYWVRR